MTSGEPIHSTGSRTSIAQWIAPGAVVYLIAYALITDNGLAFIMAMLLTLYAAFTWHSRYELYQDALVIRYFLPRQMVVPLGEVLAVRETRIFPAGDGLLISRSKGPLFIRPKEPSEFMEAVNAQIERRKNPRPQPQPEEEERPRRQRSRRRRPPRR